MIESYDILQIILALFFGAIIRISLAIQPTTDQWGVLTKIYKHKGKKWISYEMPDSLIQGIFPYPMLLHYLISFFPQSLWRVISVALNVIPDLATSLGIYLIVSHLFYSGILSDISKIKEISFLAMLLYLTLPVLLPVTARMKAANGRAMGALFTLVFFSSLAFFLEKGHIFWIIISLVFAILTSLCSIFGFQVIVFFSIVLSILYKSVIPIGVILTVFSIGFIFPSIGVKDVLLFKINHYLWYKKEKAKGTTASNRNLLKSFFSFPYYILKSPRQAVKLLTNESPLLIAIYSVVPLWCFIYTLFVFDILTEIWRDPVLKFCLVMTISSIILFIITSTERFSEWGQAERYFEYSAPMFIVLFVILGVKHSIMNHQLLTILIIIQLCTVVFIQLVSNKYVAKNLTNNIDDNSEELKLANFLNNVSGDVNVATLPIKLPILLSACTSSIHNNKVKYYYRFILKKDHKFDGFKYFQQDTETLNIFSGKPEDLKSKYGINYIITENEFISQSRSDFVLLTKNLESIYSNDKYCVYKI